MRLPLIATLIILLLNSLIDWYLWRRLRDNSRSSLPARLQAVSAVVLNAAMLAIICWPKRRGGDAGFEHLMWALYAYFSIYIPKLLIAVFDLLGDLPKVWHHTSRRWPGSVGKVLATIVFAVMWWGALINRHNIQVNSIDIAIDGLPTQFDGYTIAQISDLHTGTFGSDTSFVSKVVRTVNGLDADLVVFTGDIVNRRTDELLPFVPVLSHLHARDGVLSVLGNHDYGDYYTWPSDEAKAANLNRLKQLQGQMGWELLNNSTRFIHRQNDSIAVIGVENVGDPPFHTYGDLDAAYPSPDDPTVKILLSHNPAHWVDDIKDSPDKNIALTLAGHTHAMQLSVFGVSPAAWRYPTWGGLYSDDDNHHLYVNIGLGEVAIPTRIGATPEITLLTLRRK